MKMARSEFDSAESSSSFLIKFRFKIFLDRCRRWWLIRWLTALESIPLVVRSLWFLQDNPLPVLVKSEDFLDQNKCTKLYGFHILLPFLKNKDRDGTSVIDLIHQTSHYKIWSISQLVKITLIFEESANFFKWIKANLSGSANFKANLAARIGPFGLVGLKYGLWFLGCGERWKQRNNTEKNLKSRNLVENLFFFSYFLTFLALVIFYESH